VSGVTYFQSPCGFAIDDVVEVRISDGACHGAVVTTLMLTGAGTVATSLALPLTPGTYDVCVGGTLVRSVTVDACPQAACALVPQHNLWSVRPGGDASLPIDIAATDSAVGVYTISLLRFEDDAHTVAMPIAPFVTAPDTVSVTDGTAARFALTAMNPRAVGTQVEWPGVIIRARGPATCDAVITIAVKCVADGDCNDNNVCTADRCAPGEAGSGPQGCVVTLQPGSSCDTDANGCTIEQCDSTGSCEIVDEVHCSDDGDPCTGDICVPATGLCGIPLPCLTPGPSPIVTMMPTETPTRTPTPTFTVTPGVCGDGLVGGREQCDDGNTVGGDGCSSTCQIEGAPTPICGQLQGSAVRQR